MVKQTSKEGLWDYLIDKYHYLGYQIIVGHHLKYLSSKILSKISKYVMNSWKAYYGYEPVLLETFVDIEKFKGTSYKAAN